MNIARDNSNNFNTYISHLTTLLVFKAIFEPEALIKRSILSVLSGWYKQDLPGVRFSKVPVTFRARNQIFKSTTKSKSAGLCIVTSSLQGQKCYTTSPARLVRLYFSNTHLFSRLAFICPVQSSVLKLTV